ncbi:hypothetical protein FGG08_003121 [Glutinoglossum americanum]|uniref:25S rRNA (Uridine(2843)-N(3))-methyltransferase n=1 Tax=Glutinoglossum americanum TaxID=1670608 RepID=A0A9P8L3W9_9PEZI|nr:hypothetical protein FGG08_003121 [Glutinoglossum americanum]
MAPGGKAKDRKGQSKASTQVKSADDRIVSSVSATLHQQLLSIFRTAFSSRLPLEPSLVQQVKQHLYNREFEKAFGREEYLDAYAVRWSSSRALGYLNILVDISEHLLSHFKRTGSDRVVESTAGGSSGEASQPSTGIDGVLNAVCLGGGAGAEIVGLGGYLNHLQASAASGSHPKLNVTAVDIANWSGVVHVLGNSVTTAPPLSKYASEKAKAANVPLVSGDDYSVTFRQCDLLDIGIHELESLVKEANLITLMFTLNELYSSSVPHTTKLLLATSSLVKSGTFLLVVDSPGSYSTVGFGGLGSSNDGVAKSEKKYPMHWLLDHTLLEASGENEPGQQHPRWKKLVSDDSRWFRLPDGLQYPIELENMRYQIHLYELE